MQTPSSSLSSPVAWLRTGLKAIQNSTLGMVSITMFYIFTMSLLGSVPLIGVVLAGLFMPFGTLLIVRGTQAAYNGKHPDYHVLIELYRNERVRNDLLKVGLLYSALIMLANDIYAWGARSSIQQWEMINDRLVWESVWSNFPWLTISVTLLVFIVAQMLTWFAPMLVEEKNMPLKKAVFYSFFGVVRHWISMLVWVILIVLSTVVAAVFASLLISALGIYDYNIWIIAPVAFGLSTFAYAGIWPMWKDIFSEVKAD